MKIEYLVTQNKKKQVKTFTEKPFVTDKPVRFTIFYRKHSDLVFMYGLSVKSRLSVKISPAEMISRFGL